MYYKGQETLERTAATDASVWSSPWRLAAVELRRSLGQKRRDAFLRIRGARYISDRLVFDFHLLVWRISGRSIEQPFHSCVSARGTEGQFTSQSFRPSN